MAPNMAGRRRKFRDVGDSSVCGINEHDFGIRAFVWGMGEVWSVGIVGIEMGLVGRVGLGS